jgi:hypothetical protein
VALLEASKAVSVDANGALPGRFVPPRYEHLRERAHAQVGTIGRPEGSDHRVQDGDVRERRLAREEVEQRPDSRPYAPALVARALMGDRRRHGRGAKLSDLTIGAVTEGQDALGEVSVVVEVDGSTGAGQGVSTEIIEAAASAYVRAISVAVTRSQAGEALGLPETA